MVSSVHHSDEPEPGTVSDVRPEVNYLESVNVRLRAMMAQVVPGQEWRATLWELSRLDRSRPGSHRKRSVL
jgi:hypothetical protein